MAVCQPHMGLPLVLVVMVLLPAQGSQAVYCHSQQRTRALGAWGVVWGGQLPHGDTRLVQVARGTQSFTAHPDFRLALPRLNWQAKGLQDLSLSPGHQLRFLSGDTFPGSVLHALTSSPWDRPQGGCRMSCVTWLPGPGLGPDSLFSSRDAGIECHEDSHEGPGVIERLLRLRWIWGLCKPVQVSSSDFSWYNIC